MTNLDSLVPLVLFVALLGAAVVVAVVARRWDVPASVVFVVVGLALAVLGSRLEVPISPDLLLAIVLPGLVFEAAYRTELAVLRPAAAAVLLLAVPGVVVVAGIVAAILALTTSLSPAEAFVVGAMVAATDPASVLSTFRHIRVPARLATTVEMESLVNDGTGIVLFGLSLEVLAGHGSLEGSIAAFFVSLVGSAAIGGGLGWAAAVLLGRIDEPIIELTLTIVLAYGTYLVATVVGVSGVIATLVAAAVLGARSREVLTDRAVESIDVVWELVAFLLTAFVFLLIGSVIAPSDLIHAVGPIAFGIGAVLAARAAVVYGLLGAVSRLIGGLLARRRPASVAGEGIDATLFPIPIGWLHVLFWAGLRGAVSVALALSLPADLPNRGLLQEITFGVVLFTLLIQGTTAPWLVRRSGAATSAPAEQAVPGLVAGGR